MLFELYLRRFDVLGDCGDILGSRGGTNEVVWLISWTVTNSHERCHHRLLLRDHNWR